MKKLAIAVFVAAGLVAATIVPSFASDWDHAGKILTAIEGLRIVTGGRADVIGTITGINKPAPRGQTTVYVREPDRRWNSHKPQFTHQSRKEVQMVWVPDYVWEERFIPEHTEFRPGVGEVKVLGHFERFLVEKGGHWERGAVCAQARVRH